MARIEILPQFQGQGIGTRVLQQLVRRHRPQAVELDVLVANAAARRFYEHLGFEVVAQTGQRCKMRLASAT